MANLIHRNKGTVVPAAVTLATADDLDGTLDGSQYLAVPRGARVIIAQLSDGTLGTAGIDVIEISQDKGLNWIADPTLVLASAADQGGSLIASAALNAAGVEPVAPDLSASLWKSGPFAQHVLMRCARKTTTTTGTTWVTGAPTVTAILVKNKR